MPLRVIFRRAVEDGDLAVNPFSHLRLPAVRRRRERITSPDEAERLLAALAECDRPIWVTALYAGLRRGELMALRWADVDLANGVIRVERVTTRRSASRSSRRAAPAAVRFRSSRVEMDAALARIGETLRQIYERADARGISTAAAADVLAEERLKVR